jgi:uncharacterized protein YyaL (SSP411 family)
MPNRLGDSTSPYLLQHAANPVHWWEWCDEAFAEAKNRDLPIFLSIGYSACHWCHVMAHESFEDPGVAEFLNTNFVSIKVDREERPDIDTVYMNVTTALTGRGGWPMSLFLDGEGRPFYAGTYFPPTPAHGLPSFSQLVKALSDAWRDDREQILNSAENIVSSLNTRTSGIQGFETPTSSDLAGAVKTLSQLFDSDNGGFGNAPKFPPSMILQFLLNEYARVADVQALSIAEKTLTAMARGGIYDQLGGGFARYSVDAKWVVPHFEKMLYDNALLLRVYTQWWRITGSSLAQRVAHEIAEFMLRELRTTEGGFASAFDADSNGTEGAFYVWTPKAIHEALGDEDGALACALLNVTASGTFEDGFSTLQLLTDPNDPSHWVQIKQALFTSRELRRRPHLDDKVVASWNGLAIASLSEAGMIFSQPTWIEAAESAAELLVMVHLGHHGTDRLNRTSRNGTAGSNWGVLDDYANVAEGLLALYQVTGNQRWFDLASKLLAVATKNFTDGSQGFFYTDAQAPALVQRPKNIYDNAEPSGWFALAKALITHSSLTGDSEFRNLAEAALSRVGEMASTSPIGVGWGLVAVQSLLSGPLQVAIVGSDNDERRDQFVNAAWQSSKPGAVIVFGQQNSDTSVTLLKERPMIEDGPTVYLCREFVCEQPTNDLEVFLERLNT